jgi:hypothetical protein
MTTQATPESCRWTPPCGECGVTASKARPRYSITRLGSRWMCRQCAARAVAAEDAHRLYNVLRDVPMARAQHRAILGPLDDLTLACLRRLALASGYDDISDAADTVFDDRAARRGRRPEDTAHP